MLIFRKAIIIELSRARKRIRVAKGQAFTLRKGERKMKRKIDLYNEIAELRDFEHISLETLEKYVNDDRLWFDIYEDELYGKMCHVSIHYRNKETVDRLLIVDDNAE